MKTLISSMTINQQIDFLQAKQIAELQAIQQQVKIVMDEINPITQIKNAFSGNLPALDSQNHLAQNSIKLISGFVIRKMILGKSTSPIRGLISSFLEIGIANFIDSKLDQKKSTGEV